MAAEERIDDLISDKAIQQLDTLLQKLGIAQSELAKSVQKANEFNEAIGKAKTVSDFSKAVNDAQKSLGDMEKQQKKVTDTAERAVKVENELVTATKGKLLGIKEETKLLNSLSGNLDQNIRQNVRLKAQLKALGEERKALIKSGQSNSTQLAELATREAELRQAIQQSNLETRRQVKELNAAEGSYTQISQKLERLRAVYRDLNEEERNNVEVGGALLASIQEYDQELKNIDKSMGVTNRMVGDYSSQIQDAAKKSGLFSRELAALNKLKAAVTLGTQGATVATKSFGAALIATGIGAIILLIGSLVAFLLRTQKGMDLVAQATDAVATFMGVFLDVLSELGEQIVDNILPALQGTYDIIRGILTLDLSRIKEGFQGVSDAISNIEPINLLDVARNAGQAAAEAARLRGELQELEKAEARLEVTRSEQEAQLQRLRELANDENASLQDRRDAAKQVLELENSLEAEILRIKQEKLRITREQNALTESTEADLQRERDLEIEINDIQAQAANRRRRFQRDEQRLNRQAAAERRKQIEEMEAKELQAEQSRLSLEQSRIETSINRNQRVLEDEKLAFEDRLSNLEQFTDNSIQLVEKQLEKELLGKDLLETDRIRLTERAEERISEIRRQEGEKRLEIIKQQLSEEDQARLDAAQKIAREIETSRDSELTVLNELFNQGLISQQEYNQRRLELQSSFSTKLINEEIKAVQELIDVQRQRGDDVGESERRLAELKLRLSEEVTKKQISDLKEVEQAEREMMEARRALQNELAAMTFAIIDGRFEKSINQLDIEAERIKRNKQLELDRIKESTLSEEEKQRRTTIAQIRAQQEEERIEQKRRQIEQRRARAERMNAITGIVLNTARAVSQALPNIPLSIIVGAIGAAQLATALAQPIPQFADGTDSSPAGLAIVGERGTELRIDPNGRQSLTPDKPTLTNLKKGTQIIPNHELQQIMAGNSLKSIVNYEKKGDFDLDRLIAEQKNGTKQLTKAFTSKPEKSMNVTKSGWHYLYRNGRSRSQYISRNL